jgi:hypothetical protein
MVETGIDREGFFFSPGEIPRAAAWLIMFHMWPSTEGQALRVVWNTTSILSHSVGPVPARLAGGSVPVQRIGLLPRPLGACRLPVVFPPWRRAKAGAPPYEISNEPKENLALHSSTTICGHSEGKSPHQRRLLHPGASPRFGARADAHLWALPRLCSALSPDTLRTPPPCGNEHPAWPGCDPGRTGRH